jgi:hypothetical protein
LRRDAEQRRSSPPALELDQCAEEHCDELVHSLQRTECDEQLMSWFAAGKELAGPDTYRARRRQRKTSEQRGRRQELGR